LANLPSVAAAVGIGVAFDRVERCRNGDAYVNEAILAVDSASDKKTNPVPPRPRLARVLAPCAAVIEWIVETPGAKSVCYRNIER